MITIDFPSGLLINVRKRGETYNLHYVRESLFYSIAACNAIGDRATTRKRKQGAYPVIKFAKFLKVLNTY